MSSIFKRGVRIDIFWGANRDERDRKANLPVFANDQPSPAKVAVYFAAHEDDWQLFMTPAAFEDAARDNTKAVFVHLTAGDAGLGVGNGGRKHPLYLARENGAEAAIRFMANKDYDTPPEKAESYVTIHGHQIYRMSYRNTVAYFLRLPDGSPEGTGYEHTGFQSLTLAGVLALDHTVAWHRYDRSYVGRSYFRVEEGNDRCEPAGPMPKNVMDTTSSGRPAGLQARR